VRAARWLLVAAVVLGAAGGLLLSVGRRAGPRPHGDRLCEQIVRDYFDAWAAARSCADDGDCLLDPEPAGALRACDRARARGARRDAIAALEALFAAERCQLPEARCPPLAGARCDAGRCAAVPAATPSTPRP